MPNKVSIEDKLELVISELRSVREGLEDLKMQQEEINERIMNLSLPGFEYEVEED
ncbi:MAG TPA: hypothetical protein VM577_06860 [Anaerovoracaceae bacterium]|nr:hypothetical protein [Anaerovoracaceae bacterium]